MKQRLSILTLVALFATILSAQDIKPTKNVILMIPDGAAQTVMSASRWLKVYKNEGTTLHADPYLCGTVTTFSSNAPIGDSAPTTSCYMTGVPQQAGNVAIYPVVDPENDLVKLNPDSTYQPLTTLLEAVKIEQNKAVGLVATCEFPHATPADCSSHYYNRSKYDYIAPQIAYNEIDVVIAGGTSIITEDMEQHLNKKGFSIFKDDMKGMMNYQGDKVWALFGERDMPFDWDRNPETTPSLADMTSKAIEVLSKNENGFFMMVEGSKVDWAAHANDPAGMIGDYIAFDEAVGRAIEFAKKDGNTTVIVVPDHSNSGISIGRNGLSKSYAHLTIDDLFGGLSKINRTSEGLSNMLLQATPDEMKTIFKKHTGMDLTLRELSLLVGSKNYKKVETNENKNSNNMNVNIINIFKDRLPFGYTSGGHTGEEVFLAVYNPNDQQLRGNVRNTELHNYMYKLTGLEKSMKQITGEIFAKHRDVFEGYKYEINTDGEFPILTVKNKRNKLEVRAFSSVAKLNGVEFDLGSVAIYIDKNDTFYLPKNLADKI